MNKKQELLSAIDQQVEFLLWTRALFPYMADTPVGKSKFRTAPFYLNRGLDVEFDFGRPIDQDEVDRIRSVGHWINQNFVVRLTSILEAYQIIPPEGKGRIDQTIDGWNEVDIARRLRNQFAHSKGGFDRSDKSERRLYRRVVSHFAIDAAEDVDLATDYPLSIDVVLLPMANGCKRYVEAKK